MKVRDFALSAERSAPALASAGAGIGTRVRRAVEATLAAVGQNTNLGILLLCAPLAAASEEPGDLRSNLARTLARLDARDSAEIFAAIRLANPGGLGDAEEHDVHEGAPSVGVHAAMAAAAHRDRIARAYVTDFEDIFAVGLPTLAAARATGLDGGWPITALYLAFLARFPDTHVARKHGADRAEAVRADAARLCGAIDLAARPVDALLIHDAALKAAGINPGTSADFTVATLFAERLGCHLVVPR